MAAGLNVGNANTQFIDYEKQIIELMVDDAVAYTEPRREKWSGLKKEGRMHTTRSSAHGWTEDGGAFSEPERQQYVSWELYQRYFQGSIQLSGGALNTLRSSPNVAVDAVDSEMRIQTKDIPKLHNVMFFGDGTGKIGTVQTVTGSPVTSFTIDDARALFDGATVDVYSSGGTLRGTLVLGVLSEAQTAAGYFTCSATGGTAQSTVVATDILYWRNSKGKVYSGLDRLIEDSTVGSFQGVTIASVPRFTSYVNDNSGTLRPIDALLLRTTLAALYRKTGKDITKSHTVFGAPEQVMNFEEMYQGDFRFTPGNKTVGTPVNAFASALGNVKYRIEVDCPRTKLFLADMSQIVYYTKKKLGWRLQGGQMFLRSDKNNVWTATLDEIGEMAIWDRRSSAKIVDLEHDNTVAFGQ